MRSGVAAGVAAGDDDGDGVASAIAGLDELVGAKWVRRIARDAGTFREREGVPFASVGATTGDSGAPDADGGTPSRPVTRTALTRTYSN